MLCEVQVLDFWSELRIHVVAMKAPADDVAEFGFGATAFATGAFMPFLDERRVGRGRHCLGNTLLLLGCVLWASAKLEGAFAVVVSLHGKTTDALAVSGALPVVPSKIAIVAMAHLAPSLLLMRLQPIDAALPHGQHAQHWRG